MPKDDDHFIVERNVEHFTRLLKTEEDQQKREVLLRLLRDEVSKRV